MRLELRFCMFKNFLETLTHKRSSSLPNPQPLLAAMHNAALQHDSPEARERVYREFLRSWLWVCVPELPDGSKSGLTTVREGMNIAVNTPTNAKGVRVLPAFTDVEALANYDPNSPQMAFAAIEVFKMAVQLGVAEVIVNAFDPVRKPIRPGGTLTRREFEALAQGMIPSPTPDGKGQVLKVNRPVQIQIAACSASMGRDAQTKLQAEASQFTELSKIYRYRMRYVETGTQSEVFGLVCDPQGARFQEIVAALMSAIQPFVSPDQYVDFTQLRPDQLPVIQKHGELVYER